MNSLNTLDLIWKPSMLQPRRFRQRHEPLDCPLESLPEAYCGLVIKLRPRPRGIGHATIRIVIRLWPKDDRDGRTTSLLRDSLIDDISHLPNGRLLLAANVDRQEDRTLHQFV